MDSEENIQDIKEDIAEFCEERDWSQFHDAKELSIALSTEVSELLEHFRYKKDEEIDEVMNEKREEVADEAADILFLLARFAQITDIDLSDSLERKMEKIEERYPVEKAKGSNKKYDELDNK